MVVMVTMNLFRKVFHVFLVLTPEFYMQDSPSNFGCAFVIHTGDACYEHILQFFLPTVSMYFGVHRPDSYMHTLLCFTPWRSTSINDIFSACLIIITCITHSALFCICLYFLPKNIGIICR